MKTQASWKRLVATCLAVSAFGITITGIAYASIERPAAINPMLISVTRVNIGSTADQADRQMGMSPISVKEIDGYLLSPMVMLAAKNELTPKDQIETFTLRTYKRDHHYAVVALRVGGKVAGKWAGSIEHDR